MKEREREIYYFSNDNFAQLKQQPLHHVPQLKQQSVNTRLLLARLRLRQQWSVRLQRVNAWKLGYSALNGTWSLGLLIK